MEYDIDVSGEDILKKGYSVCISSNSGVIKGIKLDRKMVFDLIREYNSGRLVYSRTSSGRSWLKVRIYCLIIYFIFKDINIKESIVLNICKDFDGKEDKIRDSLDHLLGNKLRIKLEKVRFCRLEKNSLSHRYAYLMSKDLQNKMKVYVKISYQEMLQYLRK